jgi:cation/acetate symporter
MADRINGLKANGAPLNEIVAAERERRELPVTPEDALQQWESQRRDALQKAQPPIRHADPFPGDTPEESNHARNNFLSLVFCLMIGTAALPHILTRFYTTPSVREARESVSWSLLFIMLLFITAPAYAVFAKHEVFSTLIDTPIRDLPAWVGAWGKLGLVSFEDINRDGVLQFAELNLNPDVIVLATPEIAGLPYVVSGLVAAGGLAAALSTADGLLLTISSALSHDVYYKILRPQASTQWRLVMSKSLLLVVAVFAALVASQRPATILYMVAWAFSIAGAAFFPALVLGIFWPRANRQGAVAGMVLGALLTLYYMTRVQFENIPWLGLHGIGMEPWFGVQSTAAGVWGVLAGFVTIVVVSLLTPPPSGKVMEFVNSLHLPGKRQEDSWNA